MNQKIEFTQDELRLLRTALKTEREQHYMFSSVGEHEMHRKHIDLLLSKIVKVITIRKTKGFFDAVEELNLSNDKKHYS